MNCDTEGMPLERLTPEKRRAMTRAHLLAAASEVFAERGFHSATLDEIADAAGFSKGAVYSNFASKEELFLALIQEQGESIVRAYAAFEEAEYPDAAAQVAALADVYLRRDADLTKDWALLTEFNLYALRNPELRARLVEGGRAIHERVVELVRRQCQDAGVEPPLAVGDLATLYTAIFQGLWQQKALDPDSVPDDLAAQAIVFISDAIEALGSKRTKRSGRK